jgi:hypothetical protein
MREILDKLHIPVGSNIQFVKFVKKSVKFRLGFVKDQ